MVTHSNSVPSLGATMSTGLGRARALGALAAVGVPSTGLARASSVTNEVWMTTDYVVRVNRDALGRAAARAILMRIAGENPERRVIDVGYEMVRRNSV